MKEIKNLEDLKEILNKAIVDNGMDVDGDIFYIIPSSRFMRTPDKVIQVAYNQKDNWIIAGEDYPFPKETEPITDVQVFLQKYNDPIRPKVRCKDGFEISIQRSSFTYTRPREVELGYPSQKEFLIAEYAENSDDLTQTIYGYVPYDLINRVLKKHGGIVEIRPIDTYKWEPVK